MKRLKKSLVLFLAFGAVILTNSCNNEEVETGQLRSQDPKINQAKDWFESYKSNPTTNKSEEGEFTEAFRNLDYYWENAQVIKLGNNATGITVPVKDNPEDPEYKGQKMLYLYESDSKYQALIQEIFPESQDKIDDDQKKLGFEDLTLFSGYIITWDLKKGFLKGAKLKDGIVIGDVRNIITLYDQDVKSDMTSKMIEMFDDSSNYGGERDDTLQKGGSVAIPLNNVIVVQKSPAPAPRDFSIAGAFGDGSSSGNSGTPTGGGNGNSSTPTPPENKDALINKNKLCGTYNFIKVGNANVANISGLGFSASSPSGDKVFADLPTVCVTIPNYNLPLARSSAQFNIAWTNTMNELMSYLNNTSGIINPTPWKLRELIIEFLIANLNYSAGLNSGVSVITGTCSGVPSSTAIYCK
ncbi:hypothetical protein [Flavobacterium sp.]|uniref:hypothetical protein n=1 Tax=Flavobacterium sp. TaxID=239 RepID=UPI0031D4E8CC